jgi:hypothetical protein
MNDTTPETKPCSHASPLELMCHECVIPVAALEATRAERDALKDDLAEMTADRDSWIRQRDMIAEKANEWGRERDALRERLAAVESEITRGTGHLAMCGCFGCETAGPMLARFRRALSEVKNDG